MYRNGEIKLYREGDLGAVFQNRYQQILTEIQSKDDNYILNVSESEFAEYLIQNKKIEFPKLLFEEVYIDKYEKEIPAEWFPGSFDVYSGKKYKRDVIIYHIPFSGDIYILANRAVSGFSISGSTRVGVDNESITVEIVNYYNDPEKIKSAFSEQKRYILSDYDTVQKDCKSFNDGLLDFALKHIRERKNKILQTNDLMASLGVPLKMKKDVSTTFSVPKPELRKKIKIEPKVYEDKFNPEPTLSFEDYQEILRIINDVGKNFERMPSTYNNKGEEDLRDHILLTLDPNFEYGSASGETFNKRGKTDILLKYKSDVVFIAECKFWGGKTQYFKTFDQLISYLTYRDSKTALVIFSRNKEISKVFTTIENETKNHPNFVREERQTAPNWRNFIFHLEEDSNREINIAVLVFHLPNLN